MSINRRILATALLAGWLLALAPPGVAARDYVIRAEEWARPRSAERIIEMAPVRNAMAEWRETENARLVVLYAGGEEGSIWAGELRDWLVALGVASDRIELRPGAPNDRMVILRVAEQ